MLRHALVNGFPTGPWTPCVALRCELIAPELSCLRRQPFQTLIPKSPTTARTPRGDVRTRAKSTSRLLPVDGGTAGNASEKTRKADTPSSKIEAAAEARSTTRPRKRQPSSRKPRKVQSRVRSKLDEATRKRLVRKIRGEVAAPALETKARRVKDARVRRAGVAFSRLQGNERLEDVLKDSKAGSSNGVRTEKVSIKAGELSLKALDVEHPPVPRLAHGLDRVLFNPGVVELRDLHTRVYNFDPYLEKIVPVNEFDFSTIKQFTTASKDPALAKIASDFKKKYVGSSSSMTGLLKHFHYLLSAWRPPTLDMMSSGFPVQAKPTFTKMQRGPESGFLRWRDGAYALDSDKEFDTTNILSLMGQYMEKLLTVGKDVFERHRIGQSHKLSDEDRETTDSYHYSTLGDFVMRSQLDAYNPKLPGTGMFDLKTRTVLPIRMSMQDHEWGMDYELKQHRGELESFEREYYDMIRATLLKYSLQVRIGRMDGIFVAYHNIARIFGFQYISLEEIDYALHGQREPCLGDREFMFSLKILNDVLNKAVNKYPEQSMRIHVETRPVTKTSPAPFMYIFMEPLTEAKVNAIQNTNSEKSKQRQSELLGLLGSDDESGARAEGEELVSKANKPVEKSMSNQQLGGDFQEQTPNSSDGGDSEQATAGLAPVSPFKSVRNTTLETLPTPHSHDLAQESQTDTTSEKGTTRANAEKMQTNAAAHETTDPTETEDERQINDTSSAGDVNFLRALEAKHLHEQSQERGPLLGMVLTVRSTINGRPTTRPKNLKHEDEWEMEYSLAEMEKPEQAWNLYEACKRRRKALHVREEVEEGQKEDYFIRQLKQATERSRLWRRDLDAKDKGKPVWMWDDEFAGQPSSSVPNEAISFSQDGTSKPQQDLKPQQGVVVPQQTSVPQQDSQPGMISKSGLSKLFGPQIAGRLLRTMKRWGISSSQRAVEKVTVKPLSDSAPATSPENNLQTPRKPLQLNTIKLVQPTEQRATVVKSNIETSPVKKKQASPDSIAEHIKKPTTPADAGMNPSVHAKQTDILSLPARANMEPATKGSTLVSTKNEFSFHSKKTTRPDTIAGTVGKRPRQANSRTGNTQKQRS